MANNLYWSLYDNDQQSQSIEQLVQQDNLEKLLEVKTLSFEIRSENPVILDYLVKTSTIRRLMKHMFSEKPSDHTERAIEIFANPDALRSVLQSILSTSDLLAIPFETLQKLTTSPTLTSTLAPPHINNAFLKLITAILASSKRVSALATYLTENLGYFKSWAQHIISQQISESLKVFLLDSKSRTDDINKQVQILCIKSNVFDLLSSFITNLEIPLEGVSNSSELLSNIISQQTPFLSEIVILKLNQISNFLFFSEIKNEQLLRLHYASNLVVCCVSFMIQKEVQLYHTYKDEIMKVNFETLQKRKEFQHQLLYTNQQVEIKNKQIENFPILKIQEIDDFEFKNLPVFAAFLDQFCSIQSRIRFLRNQAPPNLVGYGTFQMLHFIARILAISADAKTAVFKYFQNNKKQPQKSTKLDWFGQSEQAVEESVQIVQEGLFGQLQLSAHSGAGGPSSIPLGDTFCVSGVPLCISVVSVIKKFLQQNLLQEVISLFGAFEQNSNLHFIASRIIIPLAEFGDFETEISCFLIEKTDFMSLLRDKMTHFIPFKSRTSQQTYFITIARALLRLAVKLTDEAAVEEKQKFVQNKPSLIQNNVSAHVAAPQNLTALNKIISSGYGEINKCFVDFLTTNEIFIEFSKTCLEPEDEIPKTFGDARLAAEYTNVKKQKQKGKGVFDAGFGGFGGFGGGGDFFGGFGGEQQAGNGDGWGDFSGDPKKDGGAGGAAEGDGFGFGWGAFQ
ncbi:Phosphorylase B kinase gamma catalytic chain [Spironucleus salmonicida]|uniref:Phosphorylase B kinase gamma catalytic chain n=1 Tax=Spironucleus salmonicida TaxID=348837 RepID=V6LPD5_9EUKA|nr:Phosphorylase B kinase gamma catalytic chain [Spironucleus salmonicida]|eukprot:EST46470.1 hypothetical protein SS50377_13552 [Spironucleus salmonicida]